jgi:synaptic vesicle membrane protein VAT-1
MSHWQAHTDKLNCNIAVQHDTKMPEKKWTILGQDPDVLVAMWANLVSWFISTFAPSFLPRLLPSCDQEDNSPSTIDQTKCISIGRPGGLEQLRLVTLKANLCTKGYNVVDGSPFVSRDQAPAEECLIMRNHAFSVNYADCAIRWGLYESAKAFVGWPIVPGFDVAGIVEQGCGNLQPGDRVFGCTLFGAYSSRVAVPAMQLRKIPDHLTFVQAAALPAVSLTALYALTLAGHEPSSGPSKYRNKAILIHSCAGGVGSMLVQMSKLLGLCPIVGVVGRSSKVETAKALGCHVVIDKSAQDLWKAAEEASPNGYFTIMDANGVSTLQQSYDHLCPTGRVIVFGFHSNLPLGRAMLSPLEWIRMGQKMSAMPKFDPMDLVVSNKAVLGFNLSFFAEEKELVTQLFDQVCQWLEQGLLECPRVVELEMDRIGEAHDLIMSGKSVGKIVLTVPR